MFKFKVQFFFTTSLVLLAIVSCSNIESSTSVESGTWSGPPTPESNATPVATPTPTIVTTPPSQSASAPPQPTSPPAPTAAPRPSGPQYQLYVVRYGDNLAGIANRFGVRVSDLMRLNGLKNADYIQAGWVLRVRLIPAPPPILVEGNTPDEKIIPDSELVYSPAYAHFDVNAVARKYNGALAHYQERVDGSLLTGAQLIQLVAERFSVGPRVLLTLLELQGGWVTHSQVTRTQQLYPLGYVDPSETGLYKQAWIVADELNAGYYGRAADTFHYLTLKDGHHLHLGAQVNPGTAALQYIFARETTTYEQWLRLICANGFRATYTKLFGDPFANAIEPLVPSDLQQPVLRLPWADGHVWFYTGGPHGGWADGSARAAVDFAPPGWNASCRPPAEWAIATAPGRVVQSEDGRVMENISGGDFQGAGWTLMYMHMATVGRARVGTQLQTGDLIGHPSCEGGVSNSDHLHFARMYNGQWIPADDKHAPMVLSGWQVHNLPTDYDGTIVRDNESRVAWNGQSDSTNGIYADPGPVIVASSAVTQTNRVAAPTPSP